VWITGIEIETITAAFQNCRTEPVIQIRFSILKTSITYPGGKSQKKFMFGS